MVSEGYSYHLADIVEREKKPKTDLSRMLYLQEHINNARKGAFVKQAASSKGYGRPIDNWIMCMVRHIPRVISRIIETRNLRFGK